MGGGAKKLEKRGRGKSDGDSLKKKNPQPQKQSALNKIPLAWGGGRRKRPETRKKRGGTSPKTGVRRGGTMECIASTLLQKELKDS